MAVLHYTPRWLHKLFPSLIWRIPTSAKQLYLTFDDGPVPEVTPKVLDILQSYNAKATFFCVGENAYKYPNLLAEVHQRGHTIGSHTYHHVNGWKVQHGTYQQEVEQGAEAIGNYATNYFRPPYGRLSVPGYYALKNKYKLVMWDVLSGDYNTKLSPEACLRQTIRYTTGGSVVVFHDSIKAWPNLHKVLPAYLAWATGQGYSFEALPKI
jgi:peptidoglycan/xylan/chitin deacetylase (PgdA/CDA1 family)